MIAVEHKPRPVTAGGEREKGRKTVIKPRQKTESEKEMEKNFWKDLGWASPPEKLSDLDGKYFDSYDTYTVTSVPRLTLMAGKGWHWEEYGKIIDKLRKCKKLI